MWGCPEKYSTECEDGVAGKISPEADEVGLGRFGAAGKMGNCPLEPRASHYLCNHEQIANHRYYPMNANGSVRWWPGEHQEPEHGHQPVRPHQSRYTKDEIQLHNQVKD